MANMSCIPDAYAMATDVIDKVNAGTTTLQDTCIQMSVSHYDYFAHPSALNRQQIFEATLSLPRVHASMTGAYQEQALAFAEVADIFGFPHVDGYQGGMMISDIPMYFRVMADARESFAPLMSTMPKRFAILYDQETVSRQDEITALVRATNKEPVVQGTVDAKKTPGDDPQKTHEQAMAFLDDMFAAEVRYVFMVSGVMNFATLLCAMHVKDVLHTVRLTVNGPPVYPVLYWGTTWCAKNLPPVDPKLLFENSGVRGWSPMVISSVEEDVLINRITGNPGRSGDPRPYDLEGNLWVSDTSNSLAFVPTASCQDDEVGASKEAILLKIAGKEPGQSITCEELMVFGQSRRQHYVRDIATYCPVAACKYNAWMPACRISCACHEQPDAATLKHPSDVQMDYKLCVRIDDISGDTEMLTGHKGAYLGREVRCEGAECRPLPFAPSAYQFQAKFVPMVEDTVDGIVAENTRRGYTSPWIGLKCYYSFNAPGFASGVWALAEMFRCFERKRGVSGLNELEAWGNNWQDRSISDLLAKCMREEVAFEGMHGRVQFTKYNAPPSGYSARMYGHAVLSIGSINSWGGWIDKDEVVVVKSIIRQNISICTKWKGTIVPGYTCPDGTQKLHTLETGDNLVVRPFPDVCKAGAYPLTVKETPDDTRVDSCVPCQSGTAKAVAGAHRCTPCEKGTYAPEEGMAECLVCQANYEAVPSDRAVVRFYGGLHQAFGADTCEPCEEHYSSTVLSDKCEKCAAGTARFSGDEKCSPLVCDPGFYANAMSTACIRCKETFTSSRASTSIASCTCREGQYWNRRDDVCQTCQQDAVCAGGLDTPTVWTDRYGVLDGIATPEQVEKKQAGTYSGTDDAFSGLAVYNCRSGECLTQPELCPEKRVGIACAVCQDGYYLQNCQACQDGGSFVVLVILLVGSPLMMWFGCVATAKPYAAKATAAFALVSTFGILAIFLQMLGMLGGFGVAWPFSFGALFSIGNIFLLDLQGIGVGCLVGNAFASQYYASFALPLFIVAAMLVAMPLSIAVPSIKGHRTKLGIDGVLNLLGMLFSALYISLVKMVVSWFECAPNAAALPTLAKYTQVVCQSPEHNQVIPAVALGLAFYVIGFYAMCLYLNINAPVLLMQERNRIRLKFLVNRWRVDIWYWGSVYMARALLLALIAVACAKAVDQFISMGVIMVFSLMLTSAWMPWKDARLAQFDNAISFIVVFSTCCGIGFMHLATEESLWARDTSDVAVQARQEVQKRMAMFSVLLGINLGGAALLFIALLLYCGYWMKNMKSLGEEDQRRARLILEQFELVRANADFTHHFRRYVETGTHYDLCALTSFIGHMITRCGGDEMLGDMSKELQEDKKARQTTAGKRLRFSVSPGAHVQGNSKARASLIHAGDQEEEEVRAITENKAAGSCEV